MSGPLGWRDVQSAIESSEKRVLAAIEEVRKRLDRQEDRMERQDVRMSNQDDRIDAAEDKAQTAENNVKFFADREVGAKMVLGAVVGTVIFIGAIVAIAKQLNAI